MNYKYQKNSSAVLNQTKANYICKNYGKVSSVKLAEKCNVDVSVVLTCLKLNGIELKPNNHFQVGNTPHNKIKFNKTRTISLYKKLRSCEKVGKVLGCSEQPIADFLKSSGIDLNLYRGKIEAFKDEIILMYKKGQTFEKIGKKFQFSTSSIRLNLKKWGIELRPLGKSNFKGKKYKNSHGYMIVPVGEDIKQFSDKKYIQEHRLVMSEFLNRKLLEKECVHHKNGIRDDNRIENLELWSVSHPKGQRVQDKIDWAISFLKDYNYDIKKK